MPSTIPFFYFSKFNTSKASGPSGPQAALGNGMYSGSDLMRHYQHHSWCLAGLHSITERNKMDSALLLYLVAFPGSFKAIAHLFHQGFTYSFHKKVPWPDPEPATREELTQAHW